MVYQPKTELARQMLEQALDCGVTARWVTGDAVYGDCFRLRWMLEERGQGYVLAVSRKAYIWRGIQQHPVGELLEAIKTDPEVHWTRLSAGAGSQGPREYDWTPQAVNPASFAGWQRGVLVRRGLDVDAKMTAFFIFAPWGISLADLALAAYALLVVLRRRQLKKTCCSVGVAHAGGCLLSDCATLAVSHPHGQATTGAGAGTAMARLAVSASTYCPVLPLA